MEVEAIENVLLSGDWKGALEASKERLVEMKRTHDAEIRGDEDELAHVLSMYLQSIFELQQEDEVRVASELVTTIAPLPFDASIAWIEFLVAMERQIEASEALESLLSRYQQQPAPNAEALQEYEQAMGLLVWTATKNEIWDRVENDMLLDAAAKERLFQIIDSHDNTQRKQPSATNQPSNGSTAHHEEDPDNSASDPILVGGLMLVGAALAIATYHHRHRLHHAISSTLRKLFDL